MLEMGPSELEIGWLEGKAGYEGIGSEDGRGGARDATTGALLEACSELQARLPGTDEL